MKPIQINCGRMYIAACAVLITLSQVAFAAPAAKIRLPDELRSGAHEHRFDGINGLNRGQFVGAGYRGPFTRSESRLGIFDPMLVMQKAGSTFTLEDASGTSLATVSCNATRDSVTLKAVSFDIDKMAYDCEFSAVDAELDGRLILAEPKPKGLKERLLARSRRLGEGSIAGIELSVESIHEYEESKLSSQVALGYAIRLDEDTVAAVDLLDWNPIVHVADRIDARTREIAIAVAVALALLRDPANSALDE